jgi:uncharacterized protein (TIGR03067 family)
MRRPTVLLLASLSLAFTPAPFGKPDTSKADLAKMQGTWKLVSYVICGANKLPADHLPADHRVFVVFNGNRCNVALGSPLALSEKWTVTLDGRKQPKAIDLKGADRGIKGCEYRGVYTLDGDTLTICSTGSKRESDRPKLLSVKQPGQWLEVFKRAKR